MADVTTLPGVLEQLRLVVGIRWRILRNGMRRKNNRLNLIGMIFAGGFGGALVLGFSFAFYAGGNAFLSGGLTHAGWIGLLFWGIFLWWQIFPVFVAGFGANFEFRTLLRFPLSLPAFYLIALGYGLADFAALAGVCWLMAMTIGAGVARPELLPAMILVCAIFVILNVTLERLLASWLERILARRKSREIFLGIVVLLSISLQFISPVLNRYGKAARPSIFRFAPYLAPLPPSLAGRAIAAAARHQPDGFLLGTAVLVLFVVALSALLWMRFKAQYRGEELSESAAPSRVRTRSIAKWNALPEIPGLLSPQVAAVLRKEFRYLTRNGFAAIALLTPPLFIFLFSMQFAGRHPVSISKAASPELFFPGMMAYLVLVLMAPAYNSFGYEQKGIQAFFLAPVRFRDVLLAKNLVLVAVLTLEVVLSIGVLAIRTGLPSTPIFAATLVALVFNVTGQLSIANWSSLSFPRKLNFGQMGRQGQTGMVVWIMFGTQILLGGISAVVLLLGRWTSDVWLPAEVFAGLSAAAMGGYIASLDAMTRFAEEKKENLMEALCR
jgi:ABC-2 type transport system permease protein